jgi:hypothetical protein
MVMVKTRSNRQIAEGRLAELVSPKQMNLVGSTPLGANMYANLDQAILIADLAYIAARLSRRDNVLAGMLIKWFDNKGTLSEKQDALGREILLRNQELLNA